MPLLSPPPRTQDPARNPGRVHRPLSHVRLRDGTRWHLPRAVDAPTGQAFEIKLAADLGVRAAGMGDVVAVEGHHMAEDVGAGVGVCRRHSGRLATSWLGGRAQGWLCLQAALIGGEACPRPQAAEDVRAKVRTRGTACSDLGMDSEPHGGQRAVTPT